MRKAIDERNAALAINAFEECGLNEENMDAFENAWKEFGAEYANIMREKVVGAKEVLKGMSWVM